MDFNKVVKVIVAGSYNMAATIGAFFLNKDVFIDYDGKLRAARNIKSGTIVNFDPNEIEAMLKNEATKK